MRREVIVGQRLPVGKDADAERRREPRDLRRRDAMLRARRRRRRRAFAFARDTRARVGRARANPRTPASGRQAQALRTLRQVRHERGSVATGVAWRSGGGGGFAGKRLGAEAAVAASVEAVGMRKKRGASDIAPTIIRVT